jgi:hypothetical protein
MYLVYCFITFLPTSSKKSIQPKLMDFLWQGVYPALREGRGVGIEPTLTVLDPAARERRGGDRI